MKKEKKPRDMGYLENIPVTVKGLINPKDARFYYVKNAKGHPSVTVCLGKNDGTGAIARGVAICSGSDTVDKHKGRKLAYCRMIKAKKSCCTDEPILCSGRTSVAELLDNEPAIDYKSEANIDASDFEKGLLATLD